MSAAIAIKLAAIEDNTRRIALQCAKVGIEVCGVTKASCGMPSVARAMLRGGVTMLGESRLENVKRLRNAGITAPIMMLRIPTISTALEVVDTCDISLNSEYETLKALSEAALQAGKTHQTIVMLEIGDRREGVNWEDLVPLCKLAHALPGIELSGVGCNFMCVSGVLPTPEKLQQLEEAAGQVEQQLGVKLRYVSGGNSANLPTLNQLPSCSKINQLRIGASILLGENPVSGGLLPGLRHDAFTLEAELVEIQEKDSLPVGTIGRDAFGDKPSFQDKGIRLRGIVNLGRADTRFQGLTPTDKQIEVIAASSDHLLVDLSHASRQYSVGDVLHFIPDYGALVQAMLSHYLSKRLSGREQSIPKPRGVRLYADSIIQASKACQRFIAEIQALGLQTAVGGQLQIAELPVNIVDDRAREPRISDAELGVLCMDSDPGDLSDFPPENTVLLGLRTASPVQAELIYERGIMAFTMEDVDSFGAREAIRQALNYVTEIGDGFALIVHASVATGMGKNALKSGLSYRECSLMMERIAASGQLRAITLSGIDANMKKAELNAAFGYLLSALGKQILAQPRSRQIDK